MGICLMLRYLTQPRLESAFKEFFLDKLQNDFDSVGLIMERAGVAAKNAPPSHQQLVSFDAWCIQRPSEQLLRRRATYLLHSGLVPIRLRRLGNRTHGPTYRCRAFGGEPVGL